jgi:hypothetical protein
VTARNILAMSHERQDYLASLERRFDSLLRQKGIIGLPKLPEHPLHSMCFVDAEGDCDTGAYNAGITKYDQDKSQYDAIVSQFFSSLGLQTPTLRVWEHESQIYTISDSITAKQAARARREAEYYAYAAREPAEQVRQEEVKAVSYQSRSWNAPKEVARPANEAHQSLLSRKFSVFVNKVKTKLHLTADHSETVQGFGRSN